MGYQIIKQPNGRYAIWSSVVDSFTVVDCTREELIEELVAYARRDIERDVSWRLADIEAGRPAYHQLTLTFDQAVETIRTVHGNDAEVLTLLGL